MNRKQTRGKSAWQINAQKQQIAKCGPVKTIRGDACDPTDDAFLKTFEWRKLRMQILKKFGPVCQCCGAGKNDGVRIHVDHIKPRRKFPDLALDEDNLQILCEDCNHGKGNWDETDWRK